MLTLKKKIAEAITAAVAEKYPAATVTAAEIGTMLEYPPDPAMGDLAFPCFKLSRALRAAPPQIAAALSASVTCAEIGKIEVAGGYLNFFIDRARFAARVIDTVAREGDMYGSPRTGEGKTVVLDYSSPNVAKPFHIGHLGTTVIGHSLKLLHEFAGYHCIGINHLGDWGTQFG